MKGLIFFETEVIPYKVFNGKVQVSPIPCQLENGKKGYYLGDDWDVEVKGKGASTESVLREKILNYKLWSEFENGYSFELDEAVALEKQGGNELVFYKCIQAHNKQSDWSPESTPALWSEIKVVGDIEVWSQPIGGDGRYPNIDPNTNEAYKVTHNGKTWENTVPAPTLNVWDLVQ